MPMPAPFRPVLRTVLLLALLASSVLAAPPERTLARGRFLIAARTLIDPNFGRTVVLLVDYDEKGAMGLIINRPTPVKLARMLPELKALKQRQETVYLGGPVGRESLLLLIRVSRPLDEMRPVCRGVQVSASTKLLERLSKDDKLAEEFRGYAGYAGWGPGQLDAEVARGDWLILPADAETIFDSDPAEVWDDLLKKTDVRFAELTRGAARSAQAGD